MALLSLFALAIAPGLAIGLYVYLKDKHEREPLGLLIRSFLFGALSIVITLVISSIIDLVVTLNDQNPSEQAVHAFFIVAFVEEFSKFIFIRWVLYNNKNFNEPFDGIVYSVMVGLGFATFENLMYVLPGNDFATAFLRMFTAVPAHGMFAILMGYFIGKAKFEHRKAHYAYYGLAVATVFHGAYDYCLFLFVPGLWIGAILSLIVGIVLSRKAIKIHQQASPFIVTTVIPIKELEISDKEMREQRSTPLEDPQ